MEGRVHEEFRAIYTPIGFIPKYEDLRLLFKQYLAKDYSRNDYNKQFSIRVDKYLEKLERVERIFREEEDIPVVFWRHLEQQRKRLINAKKKHGKSVIPPGDFLG